MLTISEEVLLLFLDDEKGTFIRGPDIHVELAMSGAVLMDLAFANRIDTDPERLFVVDQSPVGDRVLDDLLSRIAATEPERSTEYWLNWIREDVPDIMGHFIDRLVEKGILRRMEEKILWVFETRRYPVIDDREEREVKRRITSVLFSDEIPDPRDVVIIGIVNACDLLDVILHHREVDKVRGRAEQISQMDFIGQAINSTINDVRASILSMISTM
ncbi:MAG: GPP34 family phosphoprotein [Immundisolibacterales bacterium]|nr:GPP34 family phosphoprotein [Immundisolibacterales bacterium]